MKILTVIKESATSMRLLQANKPKWGEAQKKLVNYLSAITINSSICLQAFPRKCIRVYFI